jgi:hypothetical protein
MFGFGGEDGNGTVAVGADRRMTASPGSGDGFCWQATTPIAIAAAEDGIGRSWMARGYHECIRR